MKPQYKRRILTIIRFILGIIFLVSGIGKLLDSDYVNYDLVRLLSSHFYWLIEYAAPLIITVSIIELVLAVFLLWGRKLSWTLAGTFLMLIAFSSVLGYFYFQGMNVEGCGCFGAFGLNLGLGATLIRNLVLMALCIGAYLVMRGLRSEV
ncbi:MAG TPA: MauE/DoxX family redox-associated membrane protein [Fodinibius sp.]|nr:MauE/DoxX family redox-associated membrane protein [Fodinibius sp.]